MRTMDLFRWCVLAATMALAGCGPSNPTVKAITGGTLLDGNGGAPVVNSVVVVNGNDIQAVGPNGDVPVPADAVKVNVAGKFIVPGLIDVRAVIPSDANAAAPLLRALVSAGITTVGVPEGGPVQRDISPRVLPASAESAGAGDSVIASGGSTADDYFRQIDEIGKRGITPGQILTAATKNGAAWLKQNRLGVLTPGHKADLLVLNADPSADIRNLRKISRVMVDGAWLK